MSWLRELSTGKKFSIVIGIILLILFFGFLNFWFNLKLMTGIRAYVGGEGIWSKSQKAATNSLIKYSISYDPQDYAEFQKFLEIPLGDHTARLELDKEKPDYVVVKQGFIQGGNHPSDVGNLIFLYRNFRSVKYMDIAISDWTQADRKITELISVGEKINSEITSAESTPEGDINTQLASLRGDVYLIDSDLTKLENHFSATLSDGSRWITVVLFLTTFALTIVLGSIALGVAIYIGRIIVQIDRMKSEFVSMASHELRTPMSAIKGYIAMILAGSYGPLTEELKEPLQHVSISTERLIGLTNDLLDLARIDSKGLRANIVDSTTDGIINDVITNLRPIALQKNLILTTAELDEKIVSADPGFIRQILQNLIGNAMKFTNQGSIVISSNSHAGHQMISVTDSGPGIAAKDQPRMFSRFRQIPLSSNRRPPGTGLGLYISNELAKKMGCRLYLAKSEPGKGSTFVLSLPLSDSLLAKKVNNPH